MMGKTHLASGILAAQLIYPHIPECALPTAVGVVIGSLLPDIDEPNSKIGRLLPFISIPYKLLGCTLRFIGKLLPGELKTPFKKVGNALRHRQFSHNGLIVILIIAFLPLYLMNAYTAAAIFMGLAIGSIIHSMLDKANCVIRINGILEHIIRYIMYISIMTLLYKYIIFL